MDIFIFILILIFILLVMTVVHLILNRGRYQFRQLAILLGIGLPAALPPIIVFYFNLEPDTYFYLTVSLTALVPLLIVEAYSTLKGRQSLAGLLILVSGIYCFISSAVIPWPFIFINFTAGIILLFIYFRSQYKNPPVNLMWFQELAEKAAEGVKQQGAYSNKPIVIESDFNTRYETGNLSGLSVIVKHDKMIMRITREYHEKLGRPALQLLGQALAEAIKNNQSVKPD